MDNSPQYISGYTDIFTVQPTFPETDVCYIGLRKPDTHMTRREQKLQSFPTLTVSIIAY